MPHCRKGRVLGCVMASACLAALACVLAACGTGSTSTASNASATPAPTVTPTASASPVPLTAAQVTQRMRAAGLPITHVIVYTATTDTNGLLGRQGGYTSKTAWVDERAIAGMARRDGETVAWEKSMLAGEKGSIKEGGGIEVYPDVAGAQERTSYLSGLAGTFVGDGYDYRVGTAILRLSNDLLPAQARSSERTFASVLGQS
jgi:hypothetical protein